MGGKNSCENTEILFEGYLNKQSLYRKELRKRWIVLRGNVLYSYKNDHNLKKPTEQINLNDFVELQVSESGRAYQFELISSKRRRVFVASSITEMNDWMVQLRSVITANKPGMCLL